jgi:tRNA threonylcarbamoyladenosine biosynthesis protein TsaB
MPDILLLHIEAAYGNTSFAISKNGICTGVLFSAQTNQTADVAHSMVQQILDKNKLKFSDIHAVSVSSGPGSYTGLRIVAAMAKGVCFTQNLPLIAIPTLQAMAYGCIHRYGQTGYDWYIPMIDARRMEVFTTYYNQDLKAEKSFSSLILDEEWLAALDCEKKIIFFGNGINKLQLSDEFKNSLLFHDFIISAEDQSLLAFQRYIARQFEDVAYFEPDYFKAFYTPSN